MASVQRGRAAAPCSELLPPNHMLHCLVLQSALLSQLPSKQQASIAALLGLYVSSFSSYAR